ncbi:S41 family peptidase [Halonatronum saccharophilum]|uniref:S41 family peptidase n=1 Tax=Halonatronum saccharophilum TaxID=150060 RepID=UPI0004809208|nr:S41 family peptidase [Halonatronum saccharophilum]
MKRLKKVLVGMLIITMLATAGVTGFIVSQAQASDSEGLNIFRKLYVIMQVVQRSYVEEVEIDTLLTGAIDGMLESLDDPYTGYLPPKEFEDMKSEFEGRYAGVGTVITMRGSKLMIVSPIEGTPADRAGLQGGDIITAIDGISTEGMDMQQAVSMMRGEAGTDVHLSIRRESEEDSDDSNSSKEFDVDIIREDIELSYVESELREDKVGYIRLTQFIEGVGEDIEKEIAKLKAEGAQGFILDLRNNPGGLLAESAKVASNFVDDGAAVYVKKRGGNRTPVNIYRGIETVDNPLVILVNGGSASASEIITGLVQDLNRGTIVGDKTFGKGVVQSVVPLSDGSAVKLTTAQYYTPNGRFIDHDGIMPDIEVKFNPDTEDDEQLDEALNVILRKLN